MSTECTFVIFFEGRQNSRSPNCTTPEHTPPPPRTAAQSNAITPAEDPQINTGLATFTLTVGRGGDRAEDATFEFPVISLLAQFDRLSSSIPARRHCNTSTASQRPG
jgi:hypothetical protein